MHKHLPSSQVRKRRKVDAFLIHKSYIMEEKRYVATITVYTYGETSEEAFKYAQMQCDFLKRQYHNDASIEKFHFQPFGTMISEELEIHKLNTENVEVF